LKTKKFQEVWSALGWKLQLIKQTLFEKLQMAQMFGLKSESFWFEDI